VAPEERDLKTAAGAHHDGLADFTRDLRILGLAAIAAVLGVVSAVVAALLVRLIALVTNAAFYGRLSVADAAPPQPHLAPWMVLVPVMGGLLVGLLARYGSERIRGHGIPEALEAILIGGSQMEPRVAVLKPLSSALAIGTGGPFGAEGPIIMTGGALGSLLSQRFHLSAAERKVLLVAGAAAGMAAIFAAPVAAVLLAVELLLFEWRPRSLIPVAVAAIVASIARVPLLGPGPVFPVPAHGASDATTFMVAVVLGLGVGLAAVLLTSLVYKCEDLFRRLPLHWMWWPALGGLCVGLAGLVDGRVLGVGYDTIHGLLLGRGVITLLLLLLVLKALVWSVALGSGTSGGVLAPLLMMGGALGALAAHAAGHPDAGLWALIGMAAMMAGTMGAPLTGTLFAVELTHDYAVLPVLLLGCASAYLVTVLVLRRSILTEKVARRGLHVVREYTVDPFQLVRVGDVMDPAPATAAATVTVAELSARIARGERGLVRQQGLPLVDEAGQLVGIVTHGDLIRSLDERPDGATALLDAGSRQLHVTYPDVVLEEALATLLTHDIGRLPVVRRNDPAHLVGYLGRRAVLSARHIRLREERLTAPADRAGRGA
jgi:chloride channel protein, CIC family